MKILGKIFGMSLVVFSALMMVSTFSFAGSGSPEVGGGSGNNGVRTQGDAKGVKLYGSISIEYSGFTSDINVCPSAACAVDSNVVLQLQTANGNQIQTFQRHIAYLPQDPQAQANTILTAFKESILTAFFGADHDPSMSIVLVSLGEFQLTPGQYADPNYMMASITLAVN